jgi:hypothetical protein
MFWKKKLYYLHDEPQYRKKDYIYIHLDVTDTAISELEAASIPVRWLHLPQLFWTYPSCLCAGFFWRSTHSEINNHFSMAPFLGTYVFTQCPHDPSAFALSQKIGRSSQRPSQVNPMLRCARRPNGPCSSHCQAHMVDVEIWKCKKMPTA